jgi:hypothetical protein
LILLFDNLDDQVDFFFSSAIWKLVGKFTGLFPESFDVFSPGLFFLIIGHCEVVFRKNIIKSAVDEFLEGVDRDPKFFGLVYKPLTSSWLL